MRLVLEGRVLRVSNSLSQTLLSNMPGCQPYVRLQSATDPAQTIVPLILVTAQDTSRAGYTLSHERAF